MARYRDRVFAKVKEVRAQRQEFMNTYGGMEDMLSSSNTNLNVVRDLMTCI
jgi:hypothetical protein